MDNESILSKYMEQIFYFSLKKTSDRYEAEDLTQTIMTEVLTSLKNGAVPEDERAWVWKIARNHYAKWAADRSRMRGTVCIDELGDVISDNSAVDDRLLKNEEIRLLHRELALLSHDYCYIVCEYYFANRTLTDIAESLGLPPGTVKRKISECRKNLKEGMKMARTYGKRSFSPEKMYYTQNWNPKTGGSGQKYVEHLISQNILLEAYDNPCTAEDLSLSLGIAMPYMENEIKFLLEGELLEEITGKYRTSMVILSKEAQDAIYDLGQEYAEPMTGLVMQALDEIADKPERPRNQNFEDMKPALIDLLFCCGINKQSAKNKLFNTPYIKHKDGSEWAIMGLEKTEKENRYLGVQGCSRFHQVMLLGNRTDTDQLDIVPSEVPAFSFNILPILTSTSANQAIADLMDSFAEQRNTILANDIPRYLHGKAMVSSPVDFRRLVMDRMIENGYIRLPDDMNRSAVGIWNYK